MSSSAIAGRTALILGGARSGKSRRALDLAEPFPDKVMIATAEALDSEMAERIARHRAERASGWRTHEAPIELAGALRREAADATPEKVVVVDCLTLWLSNIMHLAPRPDLDTAFADLCEALTASAPATVIFISNELGLGLVPETKLGRDFRDWQGRLNQRLAATVDTVEFVAAGLPLRLKPGGTP